MESYIARQPIFQQDRKLFAYELLYRDGADNAFFGQVDGNAATRRVLSNALMTFDLDSLTKGHLAFVNFTRSLLMEEVPMLLEPGVFAIEILEDVALDDALAEKLEMYKEAGFTLALDDYTGTEIPKKVLSLLDIVKVDFRLTSREQQRNISRRLRDRKIKLLAEKIENDSDFQDAIAMGYRYFQGYYFSKPMVLKKNAHSMATMTYLKLMEEVVKPELDFSRLAGIIYPDAELNLLLLKKMRTVQYHRRHEVKSISVALARMGEDEVRRWILLMLLQNVIGKEMDELIRVGLIRAVFCECLCSRMDEKLQRVSFGAGIFSVIATKDETFLATLENVQGGKLLAEALTGKNAIGHALSLIQEYERADWKMVTFLIKQYMPDLSSQEISAMYMAAVNYADAVLTEEKG